MLLRPGTRLIIARSTISHLRQVATSSIMSAPSSGTQTIPTLPPTAQTTTGNAAAAATDTKQNIAVTTHYQYTAAPLTRDNLASNPLDQFKDWFASASSAGVTEPEGMCISTVSPSTGFPSSRMVLLRGVDEKGFTFYTNYNSRKSREIQDAQGKVAICWYWKEVSRQVRVVGTAEKLDAEESEKYFQSRPRGSRIGAHASEQSKVIQEGELQERVKEMEERYGDGEVPRPEHWGGWRIVPRYVSNSFLPLLQKAWAQAITSSVVVVFLGVTGL